MANLIVTVVSIALVALAAVMATYYGGTAFSNSAANAVGTSVINSANQITGAWVGYFNDHNGVPPNTWDDLINGNYIASIPSYQGTDGIARNSTLQFTISQTTDGHYYALAEVGTSANPTHAACLQIQKAKGLVAIDADPGSFTSAVLKPKGQYGCFNATATYGTGVDLKFNGAGTTPSSATIMTAGNSVFYYFLQ